ncbi:MAG TPA: T9SS type A sorting domain-containing protein, partial [Candidatus Marinimicrobia bacterium]|nr:T9SS type A sorting domain-containing protein [Candidatus Neomarinimicrobiota bacterium]
ILIYGASEETLSGNKFRLFTASAGFEITSVIVANVLGDAMGTDLTTTPLPETFELSQNFPNPFNPSTEIKFTVGKDELVSLNIYDIQGRLVSSLIDNYFYSAGSYKMNWDGKNKYGTQVPSGMYLYKLESSNQIVTRKMVLMK